MESLHPRGYAAVLHNRPFLALWMAQILSNTALNGSYFVQLILIEQVTHSNAHLAAVVLAFSLPAVLLSALAGLVVDRISKKTILVASNALRVVSGAGLALLAALLLTRHVNEALFLSGIYLLIFLTSAIGQFFAPAEGSTIPLIVAPTGLLAANSLFTITFIASQILGLIILAPLGVKLIGILGCLWAATIMYGVSTLLVALVPRDHPVRALGLDGVSTVRRAWNELREGWHYAISRRTILAALLQLALVSALIMMMVVIAPGYAAQVLGLSAEDAIYVFWPAAAGMFLASVAIGRFGHYLSRSILASSGMFLIAIALAGLAWAGGGGGPFDKPLFQGHPELVITTTATVMVFALLAGIAMAMINIPAQTVVQEESNDAVRGRVLAVQFTLANALAIPPTLFIGSLADVFGIPRVTFAVAVLIILLAVVNLRWMGSLTPWRRSRPALPNEGSLAPPPADSSSHPRP
ncbi:MAG: MFS transporter [Chloroflexi bacterium]|nr:MFS transporter [Chloroflexota bacterium]